MRKLLVFLVFFAGLFFLTSAYAQEKKKITKEETMEEYSESSSESKGETGRVGTTPAKKPAVKKPVAKKKPAVKKSQPSSSKKTAATKKSRQWKKTTKKTEEFEEKKPEPPKIPPCDAKMMGFMYTQNPNQAELRAAISEPATVRVVYYDVPTMTTVASEEKEILFPDGAGFRTFSADLQQKVVYYAHVEAKTAKGATCKSVAIPFWAQPPEPIHVLAQKDSYWGTLLHCLSGFVIGSGATILGATSKGQAAWIAGGLFLGGYMTDGSLSSRDISAFSLCMLGGTMTGKKASTGGESQTQASPPPATPPPSGPGPTPPPPTTPPPSGPGPNPNPTAPGPNPAP